MRRKWWLPVGRGFLGALVLAYGIPFGSLAGWYALTSIQEREVRESPEWPCGPWERGVRGQISDVLYRVYWVGISPGRSLGTRLWYPEAHDRVAYMMGHGVEPLDPERPIFCDEYSKMDLKRALTFYGGGLTFALWFPITLTMALIRAYCFGASAPVRRRLETKLVLGLLVAAGLTSAGYFYVVIGLDIGVLGLVIFLAVGVIALWEFQLLRSGEAQLHASGDSQMFMEVSRIGTAVFFPVLSIAALLLVVSSWW